MSSLITSSSTLGAALFPERLQGGSGMRRNWGEATPVKMRTNRHWVCQPVPCHLSAGPLPHRAASQHLLSVPLAANRLRNTFPDSLDPACSFPLTPVFLPWNSLSFSQSHCSSILYPIQSYIFSPTAAFLNIPPESPNFPFSLH